MYNKKKGVKEETMEAEKTLKAIGIEPIRSLSFEEISSIILQFVEAFIQAFPEQKIREEELLHKMFKCKMYLANIPEYLGSANYFYKDKAIYFNCNANLKQLDQYMIHECLHYFQDVRDTRGNLNKLGLCEFTEYKIYAMAMNEAAVQYVTCKMLNEPKEKIQYAGILLETESKSYYPILWNLIAQITYLIGEEKLITSTLFSNDEFMLSFMDIVGEKAVGEIQKGFDEILNWKQSKENTEKVESAIRYNYEMIQNQILVSYFDGMLFLIETIKEAEEYQRKLIQYRNLMGNVDNFQFYERYKRQQLQKLEKKIIMISRKNSRNMLAVVSDNKIIALFQKIRNFFQRRKEEYENE